MFLLFQLSSLFPQDSPPKMFQCCLLTELYFPSGQQCLIHMAQKKNAWFSKVISKLFLLSYATSFVVFLKTFLQSSFRFTTKLKGRFRDFPFISDPHTCIATLPWSPSLTRMVPFLQHWYITDNHAKSRADLRVHSWWILVHSTVLNKCAHCDVLCLVTQSCLSLCNSMDCSPPGSSVHGLLQARTLEWVAMPSSRGSSQASDQTQVSRIAGRFFTVWATREAQEYWGG